MKVYTIYKYEDGEKNIIAIYSDKEKANDIAEDSDYYIDEYELNQNIYYRYRLSIDLSGKITDYNKILSTVEDPREILDLDKRFNSLTINIKANSKEEAIKIAEQKLAENTRKVTVEQLEWNL